MLHSRLQYGGMAAKIAAAARASGQEPPEGTTAELWPVSERYYDGFLALESSRPYISTMAGAFPLGLRYVDVLAYARAMDDDPVATGEAIDLILALDRAFLEHESGKRKKG